jgi:hypothetical protein
MKRDDFLKLLDSTNPIPRMISVKSLGGVVMRVRPMRVSEERELSLCLSEMSELSRQYQDAIDSRDAGATEAIIEQLKSLNYKLRMQKIAYCLVDEDGNQIIEDLGELERFGVDVIEELSDKIDDKATYKSLYDDIKKK